MSFGGGIDLSKLKRTDAATATPVTQATGSPSSTAGAPLGESAGSAVAGVQVSSLVIAATEANLRDVLALSAQVPVIIEFHADSVRELEISKRLRALCEADAGRWVLVRVDAQFEQRIGQAFGVKGAPTLVAVIQGQPAPLFEGDQDDAAIRQVIDRVLQVASENGVAGVARVSSDAEVVEALPPLHQKAFDAINEGNFDEAIAAYEKALRENPRDDLAQSGLAQVKLLKRTIEPTDVAASDTPPAELGALLLWADHKLSEGNVQLAFGALLDAFEVRRDERELIRVHLLELFAVVDPANPDLAAARRRLATLLY
jgi:putative thioredoxin